MNADIKTNVSSTSQRQKLTWETPKLIHLGALSSLVLGGGGKLSVAGGDPGEPRKQKPTG